MKPTPEVLFPADAIARRMAALGAEIGSTYSRQGAVRRRHHEELHGASWRTSSARSPRPPPATSCASTQVREENAGSVRTDIVYSAEIPYEGRHILLLEGVIDTGITLNFLVDHIRERQPASFKVCALVDKPGDRKINVHPDWAAFTARGRGARRPLHRRLRPRLEGRVPGSAAHRHHPSAGPASRRGPSRFRSGTSGGGGSRPRFGLIWKGKWGEGPGSPGQAGRRLTRGLRVPRACWRPEVNATFKTIMLWMSLLVVIFLAWHFAQIQKKETPLKFSEFMTAGGEGPSARSRSPATRSRGSHDRQRGVQHVRAPGLRQVHRLAAGQEGVAVNVERGQTRRPGRTCSSPGRPSCCSSASGSSSCGRCRAAATRRSPSASPRRSCSPPSRRRSRSRTWPAWTRPRRSCRRSSSSCASRRSSRSSAAASRRACC